MYYTHKYYTHKLCYSYTHTHICIQALLSVCACYTHIPTPKPHCIARTCVCVYNIYMCPHVHSSARLLLRIAIRLCTHTHARTNIPHLIRGHIVSACTCAHTHPARARHDTAAGAHSNPRAALPLDARIPPPPRPGQIHTRGEFPMCTRAHKYTRGVKSLSACTHAPPPTPNNTRARAELHFCTHTRC